VSYYIRQNRMMNPSNPLSQKLTELITRLRHANYTIGTTQFIAAYNVIKTLIERDALPNNPEQLRRLIAPIFCHSPTEQQDFKLYFDNWLKSLDKTEIGEHFQKVLLPDKPQPARWHWNWTIFWLVLATLTLLSGVIYYGSTIAELLSSFSATPSDSNSAPWYAWATLGIAVIVLIPWQRLVRYFAKKHYLTRHAETTEPTKIRYLPVTGIEKNIFQQIKQTAQQLRKHIDIPSQRLNLKATLRQTIQAAGWFTPVSKTLKQLPEYLMLIDRASFKDHQARRIEVLFTKLLAEGVFVERYYFNVDPRRCYALNQSTPLRLNDLAVRHPDHHLMIFSDGKGLMNPNTEQVVDWIQEFVDWEQRSLFTLEEPSQWDYREQALAKSDFLIMPATEAGLMALVEHLHADRDAPFFRSPHRDLFPAYLREQPRRWLEPRSPNPETVSTLLQQLSDFLGKTGYAWFSACAVYPEIRWQLTLGLGDKLNCLNEETLTKLARLPWFRYGYMPNWLREPLLAQLAPSQRQGIYAALEALFQTAKDKIATDDQLSIALDGPLLPVREQDKPINESVFLTFMADSLAFDVSEKLYKKIVSSPAQQLSLLSRLRKRVLSLPSLFSPSPTVSEPAISPTPQSPPLSVFEFEVVTVNKRGEIIKRQGHQAEYYSEDLGNGVMLEMVLIPGGTFMMGSPENEDDSSSNEGPQHEVIVKPFLMGKYPITQAQWFAVMGNNPSHFKGDNRPVESVSWHDCVEFCKRLSDKTGKAYRLPSESEWEYACRAGTTTPFCFGETITTDLANYFGKSTYASGPKGVFRGETTDVGSFPPNAFGLYDMHGNVDEWCADLWHENYDGAPTSGSAWLEKESDKGNLDYLINSNNPVISLIRGGSFTDLLEGCRAANRGRGSSDIHYWYGGFRGCADLAL
jgi:formylglycine-generating enzyme required for sulfatase activity